MIELMLLWWRKNRYSVMRYFYFVSGWLGGWVFLKTPLVNDIESMIYDWTSPLLLVFLFLLIALYVLLRIGHVSNDEEDPIE